MRYSSFFLPVVSALALVTAGCSTPPPATPSAPSQTSIQELAPVSPAQPTTPAPIATSTALALPALDSTWREYINPARTFSFQWPTRGRYAPQWKVTFVRPEEAKREKCESTLNVRGMSFCHLSTEDAAAGSRYLIDTYDAQLNTTNIRFTFTKQVVNAAMVDLPNCPKEGWLLPAQGCVPFELATYRAHLDQIVGTFVTR